MVLFPLGEPSYLQVPWKVLLALTEGERETLAVLSDPWWSKELPKRLKAFQNDPEGALKNAGTLDQYRAKTK